jgi:hypothetical protein
MKAAINLIIQFKTRLISHPNTWPICTVSSVDKAAHCIGRHMTEGAAGYPTRMRPLEAFLTVLFILVKMRISLYNYWGNQNAQRFCFHYIRGLEL